MKEVAARYARHLYDVYNLGNSWVKESAFKRIAGKRCFF